MNTLLYCEISIFCIAVLIVIAFKVHRVGAWKARLNRLFLHSVCCAVGAGLFDLLWELVSGTASPVSLMYFINIMYFVCLDFSSYFMFLYFESASKSRIFKSRALLAVTAVPLAVLVVLAVLSAFNGCMFFIDGSAHYRRGPLFFMQMVISYGYIAAIVVRRIYLAFFGSKHEYRSDLLTIIMLVGVTVFCGILQVAAEGVSIAATGIVFSFLIMYINSLQMLISTDNLTGIRNRRAIIRIAEEETASLNYGERLYFLFIDIDSFKQINDVYGHDEGDRVLKMVASVLKDICIESGGICARYGGDEFAVIQKLGCSGDIAVLHGKIHSEVKRKSAEENLAYTVSVSIGCAEYTDRNQSVQELISSADDNMYDKKMKKKI